MTPQLEEELKRFLREEFDKELEDATAISNENRARARFFDWADRRALRWTRDTFGIRAHERLQRGFQNLGAKDSSYDQIRHAGLYNNAFALRQIIEKLPEVPG